MRDRKKLIEVALPLDAINVASAREKSIRHGHPSTLHLWWARRQLAAARAVIFSQMVDDPSTYVDVLLADGRQQRTRYHCGRRGFGMAVRDHADVAITNLPDLLNDLTKASAVRNILCHGSWRLPDSGGASVPLFVNRRNEVVETAMDCGYLDQVQRHAAALACAVINSVTSIGLQFPGAADPGKPIWNS